MTERSCYDRLVVRGTNLQLLQLAAASKLFEGTQRLVLVINDL